jgi:hypothetical protein
VLEDGEAIVGLGRGEGAEVGEQALEAVRWMRSSVKRNARGWRCPKKSGIAGGQVHSLDRLGTTDDCGVPPFAGDTSTPRHVAFAKIEARVAGTALAARQLGL